MATAPATEAAASRSAARVAPVDDEGPTVVRQGTGEGEAEAA